MKRHLREVVIEKIARAYHVPYWLVTSRPKPSWFRRPIWRWRAWRWSRES